jgi:hypothetical protein
MGAATLARLVDDETLAQRILDAAKQGLEHSGLATAAT